MAGTTRGMLSGIVSGVVWGSLVGGLVLLLAALVLELDPNPPVSDLQTGRGAAGTPSDDVSASPVPAPAAPDTGPVLMQRLDAFLPPVPDPAGSASRGAPDNGLVPRPAQPVLPRLTVGGVLPVLDAGLPPVPLLALGAVTPGPPRDRLAMPADGAGPPMIPPPDLSTSMRAPTGLSDGLRSQSSPGAREPRLAGRAPPLIAASPDAMPPPMVVAPLSAAMPLRATQAPLADVTLAPVPKVAFILDGESDAPLPGWLRARAMRGDSGALELEGGGAVFADPDATPAFRAARAGGTPALLVYARLDAADDVALDRIAARARRDGAVVVLVAAEGALWDRIGDWLQGPARDLVPVPAGQLLQ